MKKLTTLLMMMLLAVFFTQPVAADPWRAELHAGTTSVFAGLDYKGYLSSGYYRTGVDVSYNDHDNEEYRIVDGRFLVGSETLAPNLQCELGLKVLLGNVQEGPAEADITAIGFMGRVAFLMPENVLPIPVRLSATLSGAPSPLSMVDLETYSDFTTDISFFVVENAALVIGYHSQHYKLESDGDWKANDDAITIGLELNF